MKRLICIGVVLMLLSTVPAMAFMTGNGLKELADKGEKGDHLADGFFLGFVDGVIEAPAVIRRCVPHEASLGQISEVVKKYLKNHPEELHKPARDLVLKAIQTAWPCKK